MSPTPIELAGFLGCLFFLAAGVNQVMKIMDRWKENPRPTDTYATKEICEARHRSVAQEIASLRQELTPIREERKQIEHRISNELGKLQEDISRIHQRIDNIPGQLVALLKNTGALDKPQRHGEH